tara:strand:+ start:215 stop:499 length:285 start_codon:yes stop_codon:yes gene_type:complete
METIGITCHCGNKHAIILSQRLVECTSCNSVHSVDDVKSYTSYDITPLHVIDQRAQQQAIMDMWFEDVKFLWKVDGIDWSTCFQTEHEQFGVPF